MSIGPVHLNIDSWLGNALTILLLVLSSLLVFSIIFVVLFFQVILWKLHIGHYILLEAFKRISCAFTSYTIKFHNQVIQFLMIHKMLLSISQSLSFASVLAPS